MNRLGLLITLLFVCCTFYVKAEMSSIEEIKKATDALTNLDDSGNYTDRLSIADLNNLPMGILRTLNTIEYTIVINSFKTFTDHSEISVYGRMKIPLAQDGERKDKVFFFGAQSIKLSLDGNIVGEAKLQLLGDVSIPINGNKAELILKGGFNKATGQSVDLTYMEMDCNGFKELGIRADIVFPEDLIRKVDNSGNPIEGKDGRVTTSFHTKVKDWNDILVAVSLPSFEMVGLDGFVFNINKAVFDFSDSHNDPSTKFTTEYQMSYLPVGNLEMWKGIYISNLSVTLPKQFVRNGSTESVSFSANDMILDNNGISGKFTASEILSIDQGNAGGWRFSVNKFAIELEANQLIGAGFAGLIGLPISDSNLVYDAFISPDNEYFLKVQPTETLDVSVWSAQAKILPSSYVELKVKDRKFYPEAVLYGFLSINAKLNKNSNTSVAQIQELEFRKLHLRTQAPYVSVEYFGYNGEVKMKGFPLSISKIGVSTENGKASLGFDAKIGLGDGKNGFTADTRLDIVGNMSQYGNIQRWDYEKTIVQRIAIDVKMASVFSIKGGLELLNDDPVYGNGFAGNITLTIDKVLSGMTAEVKAIFGNKDFRYWYVDGRATFGKGIPVFPPVNLNGFGGGAYYKMSPSGMGSSGMNYRPNANVALGLKAAVVFNIASDKAIKGEALFEIAFNNNGGLNFMGFFGQAEFMGKIPGADNIEKFVNDKYAGIVTSETKYMGNVAGMQKLEKLKMYEPNKAASEVFQGTKTPGDAGFMAKLGIQYDFTKNSLHSTFDLYVNAAGGMIKGRSSGNRAGWAVMHIEKNEWYLHMGTPNDRLGLRFNLAGLVNMETGGYFMIGNKIPGSPPPPPQVAEILGLDVERLNYMRDFNALGDGKGIAFGSDFLVSTGDITFMILYANFQAGYGFDIMMKDYQDAQCKGRSGPVGIDGWYANGQAYAFLQGEVGVKVNLLFIKKKIPVIKGAAATLMQAKLPNPSWFAGYLGVKFDLLGGLVRGNMRLKIQMGEECELVIPGGSPLGVRVITDFVPDENSGITDVFAAPQATFSIPIEKSFEMEDDNGTKHYRLKLDAFTITESGKVIEGKLQWNSAKDAVSFYSKEILPPKADLKARVSVTFEEYQNNRWVTVLTAGKKAEEFKEISFRTGEAPEIIPMHNIEFCWPVVNQKYFYPKETDKGYVQLKRGQSYLFSQDMRHEIQLAGKSIQFRYNTANSRVEYQLPEVAVSGKYSFNLLSFSKGSEEKKTSENRISIGDKENEVTVRDTKASKVIRADAGKSLLEYNFESSAHYTFSDKVKRIVKNRAFADRILSDVINLQYEISSGEPFELIELLGTDYTANKATVSAEALLDDKYYTTLIRPLIYSDYLSFGVTISNRDTEILGVPPTKALPINTAYLLETERGINNISKKIFPFIYDLPRVYKYDFINLRSQIVNKSESLYYSRFATGSYTFIPYGYYKIKLQYILPGDVKGTAENFEYFNFIK